jgi:hypothetical protein
VLFSLEHKETGKNEISLVISDRKSPGYQLFGGLYCGWIFQIAVVKTGVLSDFYFHCHGLCRRLIFLISCSSDLYFQLVCAFFQTFFNSDFTCPFVDYDLLRVFRFPDVLIFLVLLTDLDLFICNSAFGFFDGECLAALDDESFFSELFSAEPDSFIIS